MQNTISQEQNSPKQLERLAAQRYMYSAAKRVLLGQLFLDLLSPIVLAIIVAFFPDFGIFGAFIAALIVIVDLYLENLQSAKRQDAAGIQELFDCELLGLECRDLIQRDLPGTIEIMRAAQKYKQSHSTYDDLKNWYSTEVDQLPLYLARLVCQRINCYWDAQLRKKYLQAVGVTFFIIFAIVMVVAVIKGLTLGNFFLVVVAPLIPAIGWISRELIKQNEAIQRKNKLKSYVEELWRDAIKKHVPVNEIEQRSRELQDQIYNNRASNPLILDRFYRHLLPKNEAEMNRNAKDLVNEALKNLGANRP